MPEVQFLKDLISCFEKLPGVGKKTATRYAYYIVEKYSLNEVQIVCNILKNTFENIHKCRKCGMFSTENTCEFCDNPIRNKEKILIVQSVKDIISIEKTGYYNGLYYVLDDVFSDLIRNKNDRIDISQLENNIKDYGVKEVIIAVPLTPNGEVVTSFINKVLSRYNIKITRIGFGLPAGSDLEYADELTIKRAFEYRIPLK